MATKINKSDIDALKEGCRVIFESNGIAMAFINDDMTMALVNPEFEKLTGYSKSQAEGRMKWSELVADKDDLERMKEYHRLRRVNPETAPTSYEAKLKNEDGRILDILFRVTMIPGTTYSIASAIDITARKSAEHALKESEKRLKSITANMPGIVYQFYADKNGVYGINYISERITDIFGLSAEPDSLFERFVAQVHDEDRDRYMASIKKAVETKKPWEFEGRFIKDSGEKIWFRGLSTPTCHDTEIIFDGILLDITPHKDAEEMSNLSEEKFMKIFMTTPDCIVISRISDGHIIDVNHGFEVMSGWKRNEVLGLTTTSLNVWADIADREIMVKDLMAGREIINRETRVRRKEGTILDVIYSARPIKIADDACLIFVLQDMTEYKRMEREKVKLQEQLYQSQKLEAIGQLAGGIAHDFNNILTIIHGNASMMLTKSKPQDDFYPGLSQIQEQVTRGANLTRQLLGFARGGKYEVKIISVNELIKKSVQFFIETKKEIKVDIEYDETAGNIEADAGQIEQVLLNIYINAAHAMPAGGFLHIKTGKTVVGDAEAKILDTGTGNFVKISVTDTGTGMDKNTLAKIFEPFFTTKSHQSGTGLGLASAYGIIRNHGGVIHAYSEPGKGSTFTIYLPSTSEQVESEDEKHHEKKMIAGEGGILIVEDEPMIMEIACDLLEMMGYTVYRAINGKEAVSIYTENRDRINLVFLDMIMPGMSGSEVLKLIKKDNSDVKVILTSGYSIQGEVQKVMNMGCDAFIQKPYNLNEFSNLVHKVLNLRKHE